MLRALAGRDPAWPSGVATESELSWLVKSGLGPLAWWLASRSDPALPGTWAEVLQSAEMLSRLRTQRLTSTAEWAVGLLCRAGIESTLLKGIAVATRYYPEPHLRMMGDVDLLVPKCALDEAVRLLRGAGFEPHAKQWRTHHHAPPLTHPQRDVTIELHHALLPSTAAAAQDPPFDLAALEDRRVDGRLGREPVRRLSAECELALLAAAWGNDLSVYLGRPGLQRPLLDAVLLLARTRDTLDWDRLRQWTAGTATGVCLRTLTRLLERHGALASGPAWADERRARHSRIGIRTTRAVHHVVEHHVVRNEPFGRVLTRDNTASVVRALMDRGPAWRRWLAAVSYVAFPPTAERRFHPGFMLARIRSLVRPR